jgi:hypothetical protein
MSKNSITDWPGNEPLKRLTLHQLPELTIPAIDIRDIHSLDDAKRFIEAFDLIFAIQRDDPDNTSIVFGTQFMRTIAQGLVGKQTLSVGGVFIDFSTDELEALLAFVQIVKGFEEYGD